MEATTKGTKLIYPEVTKAIIGAAYEVHRELGSGFLEKVYETALVLEFSERGLEFDQQAGIEVRYKGRPIGHYVADLLIDRKVILEIKVASTISSSHEAQLLNYLKATGIRVGLILNFGRDRLQFRRLIR